MNTIEFQNQFGEQQIKTFVNSWCIYFLCHNNEIVYVGKSSLGGVWSRLKSHRRNKVFDSYFVIDSIKTENEALRMEGAFISALNPKYNVAGKNFLINQFELLINWKNGLSTKSHRPLFMRILPYNAPQTVIVLLVLFFITYFFVGINYPELASSEDSVVLIFPFVIAFSYWMAEKHRLGEYDNEL